MSPEDYLKYKSSFEPTPQKEEVPLALQVANKTKERGSVLGQIERERVLVSDLNAKYEKHTEALTRDAGPALFGLVTLPPPNPVPTVPVVPKNCCQAFIFNY